MFSDPSIMVDKSVQPLPYPGNSLHTHYQYPGNHLLDDWLVGIAVVAAQGVFSLPGSFWSISSVAIRIFAIYLCIRTLQTFICCKMTPTVYSRVCLLTVSSTTVVTKWK